MNRTFKALLGLCATLFVVPVLAQDKNKEKIPYRFGKVTAQDFAPKVYSIDSAAHAVILCDVGNAGYNSSSGSMEMVFHRYTRVRILHKAGYDAADFSVRMRKGASAADDDRLTDLKAVTYNLENGQVVETKLDSKSVFTTKVTDHIFDESFTLPNVKEGSIIEVSYDLHRFTSYALPSWRFQGKYPREWCEYDVSIPELFNFVFMRQGYYPVTESKETRLERFHIRYEPDGATGRSESSDLEQNVTDYRFVSHNMPALHEEPFTTTIRNHEQAITFQLASIRWPSGVTKNVLGSWSQLAQSLLEDENFGASLSKNNGYLADVVKQVTAGAQTGEEKARRLYAYIQHNYSCTEAERLYMDEDGLKAVFNNKKGNSTALNLLLVAMLRRAGLQAWPIILSTRDNGTTPAMYPLADRYNYVVVYAQDGDQAFSMDASRPLLGFNHLPLECYNGHARMVTPDMPAVFLEADSLQELDRTTVMATLDSTGNLTGNVQSQPGYYGSYKIRRDIHDKGNASFFKETGKSFYNDALISNEQVSDLDSLDVPLMTSFDFKVNSTGDEDHLYLTPLFGAATRENPFAAVERRYPVEFPYMMWEMYTLNLALPPNYEVEELPKPAVVKLNEVDGVFQYLVQASAENVQLRVVVHLTRANFQPEEYNDLRAFFDYIVKKEAEQIVLKKKA
ncbi:transglutaminase-like domain-containing protein [Chitinophaga parva]|nr:transglutaminase domain-containing protein [Chitinophaga parva]